MIFGVAVVGLLESLSGGGVIEAVRPWFEMLSAVWHTIESGVLLFGLWWISRRLKSERRKLKLLVEGVGERVETFGQFAKAARDAAEAATSPEQGANSIGDSSGLANWDALRSEWQDMRDRIELAIERISHKTVRGKYSKINRYSYRDVIVSLHEDGEISSSVETALLNMNVLFLGLRARPAKTTSADLAQMRAWVKAVNGALPKLPKPRPPTGAPNGEPPN